MTTATAFAAPNTPTNTPSNTLTLTPTSTPTLDCCQSDKVLGTGTAGGGVSQISGPLGIAVGTTRVYVADGGNNRIDVYDKSGIVAPPPITEAFWTANTSLIQGLALDGFNYLYAADFHNNMVFKIDLSNNAVVTTFNGMGGSMPSSMNGPIGIWCNSQGTTVVVVENLSGKRVRIFQQQGGGYFPVQQLVPGAAATNFTPVGVTADAAGNLYVSDDDFTTEFYIWKFAAPSYASAVTVADNSTGHLLDPRFMTFDSAGDLYVGNRGTIGPSSFSVFDSSVSFIYQCFAGAGVSFINAQGVGVDEFGHVYITDEVNNRVVRYQACPLVTLPTPTFTSLSTPTPTMTNTPTNSPTLTTTISPTNSPTYTPTKTPTNSPTNSPTPTMPNSPTPTPTSTMSPTPISSATATATAIGCGAPIESYCYPNPAVGNSATVLFNLCESGSVQLNLYNVAANLVETYIFQGSMGVNNFPIDIGGLSHGIYYYVVKAQSSRGLHQSKTCKFAVVR